MLQAIEVVGLYLVTESFSGSGQATRLYKLNRHGLGTCPYCTKHCSLGTLPKENFNPVQNDNLSLVTAIKKVHAEMQ